MKQQYLNVAFRSDTAALIDVMNQIIDEYTGQGFRLTVRQLYYQLVARAIIENTERSYKRTTSIVNDARMAGLMDWDAIEDRTRAFIRRARWETGAQILSAAASSFHVDMWANQDTRVFCIVEKEALAGVLEGVCNELDIPLLAARGYPSGTVLREFAESDVLPFLGDQYVVILHFGDHDPSGIDMTRDLRERIQLFSDSSGGEIELKRIALTMRQIDDQSPPPNPAKTTDSRFADYRRKYGTESWELDALRPDYLAELVRDHASEYIDDEAWADRITHVESVRRRIIKAAEGFEV